MNVVSVGTIQVTVAVPEGTDELEGDRIFDDVLLRLKSAADAIAPDGCDLTVEELRRL